MRQAQQLEEMSKKGSPTLQNNPEFHSDLSDLFNIKIGNPGKVNPGGSGAKNFNFEVGEPSIKIETSPIVVIDGIAINDEQINKFKDFDNEISNMITSEKKQSENNTINLLILQEMVRKYFTCPATVQDPVAQLVQKIAPDDMLLMLSSIKFKDKDKSMILAYISKMVDILLELVIDPKSFKQDTFRFGTMISRDSKSVNEIFKFLVKNGFQQTALMKSQMSSDLINSGILPAGITEQHLSQRLKVLKGVICCMLQYLSIISTEASCQNVSVGFQFLSSGSIDGNNFGNNFDPRKGFSTLTESNFLSGSLGGRSNQLSSVGAKKDYSFDPDKDSQISVYQDHLAIPGIVRAGLSQRDHIRKGTSFFDYFQPQKKLLGVSLQWTLQLLKERRQHRASFLMKMLNRT